jgi:DNA-binding transcriptional LysR family regulator
MPVIPSELLKTFLHVVEFRSFTRTAEHLGLTQPAISSQIKRIQELLGDGLFDKSAPGVALTKKGELAAEYARKILALNDELVERLTETTVRRVKIGVPGDFAASVMSSVLVDIRKRFPDYCFVVSSDRSDVLLRRLRQGDLDLAVVLSTDEPTDQPRHRWGEEVEWVTHPSLAERLSVVDPVPLVLHSGTVGLSERAQATLAEAGRRSTVAFEANNLVVLSAAVFVGIGVMPMPRRAVPELLSVLPAGVLPRLPHLHCGVYVENGEALPELIADEFARAVMILGERNVTFASPYAPPRWLSEQLEEARAMVNSRMARSAPSGDPARE